VFRQLSRESISTVYSLGIILRKAKILITLGPASREPEVIEQLLAAGANGVRINMSHGSHLEKTADIERARAAAKKMGISLAVLVDLSGPKIRTGELKNHQPVKLEKGAVFTITTDDQPTKGSANASVTIVEFTDFECPSSARQHPVLDRIVSEFGDRVRLVVRDFPLLQHANARKAAEAAEAAREQGKYWEYASVLFRNQSALGVDKLKQYATELGLDRARFDASLDSGKFAEKVQRDVAL